MRVAAQRLAQLRHQRLRRYWLTSRPLVLLAAAVVAIVLGFWGFRVAAATRSGDVLDSAYRTVRLFGLASGDILPPVPWQIQVARMVDRRTAMSSRTL